jgi:hypothetical protein
MKAHYFLIIFVLVNNLVYSQSFEWAKGKQGTSEGRSIGYDKDGNVICSGSTPTTSFIEKYSNKGELLWSKSIFNPQSSIVTKVDSVGNIFAIGNYYQNISFDDKSLTSASTASFLVKFNSSGSILWLKSISDVHSQDISLYYSGFYIIGNTKSGTVLFDSIAFNNSNLFIAKYDEFGKCLWVTKGNFNDGGSGDRFLSSDNLGNVYCISPGTVSNSNHYYVVSKYNVKGGFLWAKDFGGNVRSIFANQNKLYISGDFGGSITIGDKLFTANNEQAAFIIKMDTSGSSESFKVFNSSISIGVKGVTGDNEGSIYFTGNVHGDADLGGKPLASGNNGAQVFVAKFNSQLASTWVINSTSTFSSPNFANAICYNKFNNSILFCGIEANIVKFGNTTLSGSSEPGSMFVSKITDAITTTGIQSQPLNNLILISPNPTTGVVKIDNLGLEKNIQVFVRNILGDTLLQKIVIDLSASIDLSEYPKGVYFIDVLQNNEKTTKRIVLQ